MSKRIAWAMALAAASVTLLAACASSSSSPGDASSSAGPPIMVPGSVGSVYPATAGAETAGTITWAEQPGQGPTWIFPITGAGDNAVFNLYSFSWEMWRPTYWTVYGVTPTLDQAMSLAQPAVYSDGDRTVSITFKKSYRWSDGAPVTADDLLFDIDLIKAGIAASPANWSGYSPGNFPSDLASTTEPNRQTLVLHLTKPVNPVFFTDDILAQGPTTPLPVQEWARTSLNGPLVTDWKTNPADDLKIFNFLIAQNNTKSTYASNPLWQVVDGPYKLSAFSAGSGGYTMTPNPRYGGPHAAKMSAFQAVPFTSEAAEMDAILAKTVDVAQVPLIDVRKVNTLSGLGYHYFGEPDFGMNFANYNFKDKTGDFGAIANQLYFRQAMQHLEDQEGWVTAFFHGAGASAYGPIPVFPQNGFLPAAAANNPYVYSKADAISLLKSNGWTINANGTDVCSNPGTGTGECGAGIPGGTKLAFNLIYTTTPGIIGLEMTDLASQAAAVGIHITLQSSLFDYMLGNYVDPESPGNDSKWAMEDFGGEGDDPYPTTVGLFNTGGGGQIGDFSDPKANQLINASVSSGDPLAVGQEATYLTDDLPVMWQPVQDLIWAWKSDISGPPDTFENLTQYYATPEFWYFTK